MIVLGKNVLLKVIESAPVKHGDFYQSQPPALRIKLGEVFEIGNVDESLDISVGDKVFYDVSNQRQMFLEGEEYFLIPQDDLLVKEKI